MNSLTIATCNVNRLKNKKKRKAFFTYFRVSNYDIIFLQETHCHQRKEQKLWSLEWDGQSIWSLGSNHSKGVCVLFNRNYNFDFDDVVIDLNGRYISFDLNIENSKYRFLNIYAPNLPIERISFFKMIQRYIVTEHENIVGGDFNCTLNPAMDRLNCTGPSDVGNREILDMMYKFDLEDICRRRFPTKRMFSWSRGTKASRIDYWLISKSLDNQVDRCNYKICPLSDHEPVEMTFRTTETKCGKGIWKINVDVLTSELFQKSFKSFWSHWQNKKNDYKDLGKWWDLGKKKIKELAISISKVISKKRHESITELQNNIEKAQQDVSNCSLETIDEMKNNLKKLLEYRGEGARVRSRVNWHEDGEISSQYFFNLEKRNAKEKAWENILDAKGQMTTGLENILETQVKFYSKLYKAEQIEPDYTFLNCIDTALSDDHKLDLDKDITLEELGKSLKQMKNNKSPGPDGLVTEFYKFYWENIGQDLFEVFQYSLNEHQLPHSQYLAVIRLLFKKGQRENLKNWRPISLLNTDVKILTKLLAERLIKVLPSVIHRDQKGCVKGRYIGENITLIRDLVESCEENEAIILVDQQKAFDRVEFNWLFKVLEKLKFGEVFIGWLKLLYKDMKSCILTNGYVSSVFPVTRGIRQGDSLSALLYILQLEPLAAYFRKTQRISGIEIQGFDSVCEVRNKHYVDDTIICLKHINMTDECLNIIEEFGKVSGSKLNRQKTVGLVMNDKVIYDNMVTSEVDFTLGPVKVLGVPLGKKQDVNFWETIIKKIEKKLSAWKNRHLSLIGKVLIIKSLGMSQLLFSSNFITMEENVIKQIENLFFKFLWGGKKIWSRKKFVHYQGIWVD
jgi:exonuclease III